MKRDDSEIRRAVRVVKRETEMIRQTAEQLRAERPAVMIMLMDKTDILSCAAATILAELGIPEPSPTSAAGLREVQHGRFYRDKRDGWIYLVSSWPKPDRFVGHAIGGDHSGCRVTFWAANYEYLEKIEDIQAALAGEVVEGYTPSKEECEAAKDAGPWEIERAAGVTEASQPSKLEGPGSTPGRPATGLEKDVEHCLDRLAMAINYSRRNEEGGSPRNVIRKSLKRTRSKLAVAYVEHKRLVRIARRKPQPTPGALVGNLNGLLQAMRNHNAPDKHTIKNWADELEKALTQAKPRATPAPAGLVAFIENLSAIPMDGDTMRLKGSDWRKLVTACARVAPHGAEDGGLCDAVEDYIVYQDGPPAGNSQQWRKRFERMRDALLKAKPLDEATMEVVDSIEDYGRTRLDFPSGEKWERVCDALTVLRTLRGKKRIL